jgi:hypothetical protein
MSSMQQHVAEAVPAIERRRSKRVAVAFQIEVSGREPRGDAFHDRATTIDVNEHGCKFNLARQVQTGDTLTICLLLNETPTGENNASLFQIVWAAPSDNGCTVGAMRLQDKRIWPMNFPEPTLHA